MGKLKLEIVKFPDRKCNCLVAYNDTTEDDILRLMTQLCKTSPDLRVLHLEPAAEVTEETKHLVEELKRKINCKPFSTTEPIDTSIKEDDDPFCLNLTTIQPPHPGGA